MNQIIMCTACLQGVKEKLKALDKICAVSMINGAASFVPHAFLKIALTLF